MLPVIGADSQEPRSLLLGEISPRCREHRGLAWLRMDEDGRRASVGAIAEKRVVRYKQHLLADLAVFQASPTGDRDAWRFQHGEGRRSIFDIRGGHRAVAEGLRDKLLLIAVSFVSQA